MLFKENFSPLLHKPWYSDLILKSLQYVKTYGQKEKLKLKSVKIGQNWHVSSNYGKNEILINFNVLLELNSCRYYLTKFVYKVENWPLEDSRISGKKEIQQLSFKKLPISNVMLHASF